MGVLLTYRDQREQITRSIYAYEDETYPADSAVRVDIPIMPENTCCQEDRSKDSHECRRPFHILTRCSLFNSFANGTPSTRIPRGRIRWKQYIPSPQKSTRPQCPPAAHTSPRATPHTSTPSSPSHNKSTDSTSAVTKR